MLSATSHIVCWVWNFHMQKADDSLWVEGSMFYFFYISKDVHNRDNTSANKLGELYALWIIGGMAFTWENFFFLV